MIAAAVREHGDYYTHAATFKLMAAAIVIGLLLLAFSKMRPPKAGRTPPTRIEPPVGTRGGARRVLGEEPKPGTRRQSMAIPRPRPNGGERSPRRPDIVVINGVEFTRQK